MILFALKAYEEMAAKLANVTGLTPAACEVLRFENGEIHLAIKTSVRDKDCFVLGTIAPPDEDMFTALLLAHTLKKECARTVTAILPYLAYARHDKEKPGESLATAWVGAIMRVSGFDEVITVDVHSRRGAQMFPIPVLSLSPAELFAEALCRSGLTPATIVAPDEGAIDRCQAVKRAAGIAPGEIPYFEKHRAGSGIAHVRRVGEVGRQVVIVDDILDTGGTLVSACERLREAGAEEIHVIVTHGLFTGERWKELWRLGVKRIFCTDSVPSRGGSSPGPIERISVVPLLGKELRSRIKERIA